MKMNNISWLTIGILAAAAVPNAQSRIQVYDGFSATYPIGMSLNGKTGGTGFSGPWVIDTSDNTDNTQRFLAQSYSPAYTDAKNRVLKTEDGSLGLRAIGSGNTTLNREFENELTGTFWISFLTQMDKQVGYGWDIMFLDAAGEMQFKFMNGRAEQNRWRIQSMKTGNGLPRDGLFKSKPGSTPTDLTLVILKVVNAGSGEADGKILAYLNPTDLRDAEIAVQASLKISGLQLNPVRKFSFKKNTIATGCFDELRMGTDLEDVLPQR
ncbi:hypothetical protein PDESU_02623 [Pontiella desulfatans]|uniref:Uncharacterized protein n=1 Tax=Pontiella desulfatans TaxID=2750659 RepID=A0A6C2U3W5_PONDE|nr:hypothetical protein [Pontiella desulfatans]VGO14066.1 hypothetical protein PDESU_02623 [Pontiella desulfatans]